MNYQIGSTLGDYQIVGVLGAGGMGEVYKVRNVISDRVEAMKVLLPDLAQHPELADRFLREIKVQASLEHPNIAGLHTAVRLDNQLLMLMEYVEGVTLDQRIKQGGPLPVADAVNDIRQVLAALEYAHALGVVHRDIKPANMMLMPDGGVKLMDFGIAKSASDRQLTVAGTTIGSLYYMSPEQIQGSENVDARSDLYSVGVSLYELVTGKRPFDGDSQYAIMAAHLEQAPVPPIQHDPGLPQALNDIILMSVAKDPNARFQSAAAFGNALSRVISPPQATTLPLPAKPKRGNRGLWMGAGALATVAAIIAVVQFGPKKAQQAATVPPAITRPAPEPIKTEPAPLPPDLPAAAAQPEPAKREAAKQETPESRPLTKMAAAPAAGKSSARTNDIPVSTQAPVPAAPAPTAPPPAQQVQQPPASQPQVSAPSRAELQAVREQTVLLSTRAGVIRTSLQSMQQAQASQGRNLRADMQEAAGLMGSYLDGAKAALAAGDAESARSFMDKAERQIEKLEKFLGH